MTEESCSKCGHYLIEIEGAEVCPCGAVKITDLNLYNKFEIKNLEILWRAERRRAVSAYYIWEEDY